MTRLRESIEKAATAPLTEDERQELQPPSMRRTVSIGGFEVKSRGGATV
jgi:hypothetical protein